ncbi:carbohydrate ABC transporter substrate-binding protein [Actinosynnema pretiosum subsp. pretiosum]|uniref:Extracellular solute-binding protein family 1 n=2 Tax=Actinosynnema TaxID=40566 RepID=C6WLP9_ACTMD|nr:ABC transporter substrate-binding protein [Actinosynnema mirum]ACU38442.1 extracellular solute-binding protein family 1 [Actinosynnema mirum DSM 43827]AXX31989.1 putative secreted solute-binding lipoprotein [Actinosynnema pretiosum subsp. pretiosum]QUF04037.1 carbohydrate ABC transporter substrate-binding protein [Actinosynnema pretiosum subsp. pretiosum]
MSHSISRRTLLRAAIGGGVAAPFLAGCGALTPASGKPGALSVHTQLSGAVAGAKVFADAVAAYERRTGRPVALLKNGSDLPIVFETSSLAGAEADVALVNLQGRTLSWTGLGATIPLTGLLDEWGLRDKIIPEALAEWTDGDGNLRAFPFTRTNWPVSYNTRLLEQAGVQIPTTSDELIAVAQALRAKGIGPVTVGGSDWSGQKMFLQVIQGFLTPDEAKEVFGSGKLSESPAAIAGVEHFVELRDAGVFVDDVQGYTSDSELTQFNTGKAAIVPAMSSALAKVPAERAKEVVVGGWPKPSRGGVLEHPSVIRSFNGHGIWISRRGAEKLDLIKPFVQDLYSDEVIDSMILGSGRDMSRITDTVSEDFPLVAQASRLTDQQVSPVMLPDLVIPQSAFEPMIQATAAAYGPIPAERIIEVFERAYATV